MNINLSLYRFGLCCMLSRLSIALASETVVLDFESPSSGLNFPGVAFEDVAVRSGEVGSSPGLIFRTAPAGTNAAFSAGAKISFSIPVIKATMLVSSSFISVPLIGVNIYLPVRLCAYGSTGELLTTATGPVLLAVAEPELLHNFTPTLISIAADVPIAQLTIDLGEAGDPFDHNGTTFFFDDLTLTVQEQLPARAPTLHIERRAAGKVFVSWDISSAELQQSADLSASAWQRLAPWGSYVLVDTTTNTAMFFRAVRPTP
jgi:hypothetical protein